MTPEDRARIARENGAKSRGPITAEGKAKVAANAIKTGEHIKSETLAHFLPPHRAVLCNEDLAQYNKNLRRLYAIYQPVNQLAAGLVQDIATAKWQIARYQTCLTLQWNLSIVDANQQPAALPPEFREFEAMARSTETLLGRNALARKITREIGFLQKSVASLEKQIAYIHKTFPNAVPPEAEEASAAEPVIEEKQTQPSIENEELSEIGNAVPAPPEPPFPIPSPRFIPRKRYKRGPGNQGRKTNRSRR